MLTQINTFYGFPRPLDYRVLRPYGDLIVLDPLEATEEFFTNLAGRGSLFLQFISDQPCIAKMLVGISGASFDLLVQQEANADRIIILCAPAVYDNMGIYLHNDSNADPATIQLFASLVPGFLYIKDSFDEI